MRFYEFTIKPLTPQKAQIDALKQQKERATNALKNERVRQQKQKAVAAIQKNNQTIAKLNRNV